LCFFGYCNRAGVNEGLQQTDQFLRCDAVPVGQPSDDGADQSIGIEIDIEIMNVFDTQQFSDFTLQNRMQEVTKMFSKRILACYGQDLPVKILIDIEMTAHCFEKIPLVGKLSCFPRQ